MLDLKRGILRIAKPAMLVIAAFLVRGLFYCAEQPIWEGFDEWAHFAYIQHLARYGYLPSRGEPVSDELRRAIALAPLSPSAAESVQGSLTHDEFWSLAPEQRVSRESQLQELRPNYTSPLAYGRLKQYEAQQPPLYYLLLIPIYMLVRSASLPAQVMR